jgi:hypothetical protein
MTEQARSGEKRTPFGKQSIRIKKRHAEFAEASLPRE